MICKIAKTRLAFVGLRKWRHSEERVCHECETTSKALPDSASTAEGATVEKECSTCAKLFSRSGFGTNNQWRASAKRRKCKGCARDPPYSETSSKALPEYANDAEVPTVQRECSACGQLIPRCGFRSDNQWNASAKRRKCKGCDPRPRGSWRCISCKEEKAVIEFSEWRGLKKGEGLRKKDMSARCNACTRLDAAVQAEAARKSVKMVMKAKRK